MRERTRELERALEALDASFHVRLISTFDADLVCAPAEADAVAWLETVNPDFDQFPVTQGKATVGVLLRQNGHAGKLVREVMNPLSEGMIVSADMPITRLIPQLRESPFRLVLRGSRIDGLVTQSDLLKLPVRLVIFGLMTHLEQVMADAIVRRWPDDAWLEELDTKRRKKTQRKEEYLSRQGMNPPKIELTEFLDKQTLCERLVVSDESQFKEELDALRGLRDQIAHASRYVDGSDGKLGIRALADKFESAQRWIAKLTSLTQENEVAS